MSNPRCAWSPSIPGNPSESQSLSGIPPDWRLTGIEKSTRKICPYPWNWNAATLWLLQPKAKHTRNDSEKQTNQLDKLYSPSSTIISKFSHESVSPNQIVKISSILHHLPTPPTPAASRPNFFRQGSATMLISKAQCSAKAPIEMPESEAMRRSRSNFRSKGGVSSRGLTYISHLGKLGKSSSKCHFWGDMLVSWRCTFSHKSLLFVASTWIFGRASTAVHSVPHMSGRKSLNGLLETWQVSVEDTKTILTPTLW